ncbi:methylthioribose-binding protein [Paenibacillus baekrokdamisoli]|uniref:Methylthioribose-binding protein n=1 Tax=Paenibacillus baekrokdamisoli TaxID=1712516 RepID=A0A3G9J821_9BACL|nr:sugar ABC transporter substrate-binding protein [Paenibacillus baekrokdamisoli]MBB3069643.1 simple sugar transport system substrate-binding protein [Paenibacillus baekrokdamisoli]BBH21003.1 methylthioribose-binding protein [Paenibacillus baekrokdamisoli]
MKQWGKSSILFMLVALVLVVSACGSKSHESNKENTTGSTTTNTTNQTGNKNEEASLKGKKIALVMQFNTGTFSSQYIAGVKDQVGKLGGEVQVFAADGDLAKMATNLDAAVNQGFDGILIDHGQAGALEAGVKNAVAKNIPVVVFDADIKVPGVTVLQQDDKVMADMSLEQLAADAGGKGTIVKVWVAGFAPMERRQTAYKAFQAKYPDLKEISAFGNATNPAMDTQAQMEAILKKYPNKGDITAVWAAWDEFAKGASRAIQQAGRTEIKVYGIDMSDEDLQMIQDPASPWVASAAVDPKDIGRVQVRYLYQKLHGDQTDDVVVLNPVFVKREELPKAPEKVNTTQLNQYVKGWGNSDQGYTDWLKALETSK